MDWPSIPGQIYVVQSAMVKDLSASPADLAVSLSAPVTAATGSTFHWTVTVTNNGPNQAQGINLNSTIGDSILVQSVKASQGACAGGNEVSCNLGSLANGSTATVTVTAVPGTAGTVQSTASVSSVSYDPTSTNNQATASTTVTGGLYSATPVLSAISPALVEANSGSFTLTVTGSGFNSSSAVQIDGVAEPTTWVSATSLTAAIPASAIVNYGWAAVTVSNPSPGGGNSQIAPLTIYALVNLPANGIAYDSFTQKIYATLPSTATGIMGNSVIALDPVTAKVGPPVLVGSEPDIMAETSDGDYLYIGLSGADSLARFNLATQSLDATIPLSMNQYGSATNLAAGWMTVMPGTDSTLAIATAQNGSLGILDIAGNTGVFRANLGSGSNPVFLDAGHLDVFGYGLFEYAVNADGLTPISTGVGASLSGFGGLGSQGSVLANGLLYGIGGGIANPLTTPPSQVADLNINQLYGLAVAPDPANETDFLVLENAAGTFWYDLCRYDTTRYIADSVLTLPAPRTAKNLAMRSCAGARTVWRYAPTAALATQPRRRFCSSAVLLFCLRNWSPNPTPQLATSSVSRLTSHQGNTLLTLRGSGSSCRAR